MSHSISCNSHGDNPDESEELKGIFVNRHRLLPAYPMLPSKFASKAPAMLQHARSNPTELRSWIRGHTQPNIVQNFHHDALHKRVQSNSKRVTACGRLQSNAVADIQRRGSLVLKELYDPCQQCKIRHTMIISCVGSSPTLCVLRIRAGALAPAGYCALNVSCFFASSARLPVAV